MSTLTQEEREVVRKGVDALLRLSDRIAKMTLSAEQARLAMRSARRAFGWTRPENPFVSRRVATRRPR